MNLAVHSRTQRFWDRSMVCTFAACTVLFCSSSAASAESTPSIPTPDTIQRLSGESAAQFAHRKQRITYGTPENRRACQDEIAIEIGLCKNGSVSLCSAKERYKTWCVAPGENADAAIAKLPPLSREQYFDYRESRWITRIEYCSWLSQQRSATRRGASTQRELYEKSCTDLPRDQSR
jgi:hypothetical protein